MNKQPCVRAAGLLLAAMLLVACSKQPASEPLRSAADDTAVEHALKHTNPQYRCPMHPDIVRDEPGTCPICGMTLVKIESPAGPGTPSSSASASGDPDFASRGQQSRCAHRSRAARRPGAPRRSRRLCRVRRTARAAGASTRGRLGRRTCGPRDGRNGAAGSTAVHAVLADARKRAAGVPRRAARSATRT